MARQPLTYTPEERVEIERVRALTSKRYEARSAGFTPFGTLLVSPHVTLRLVRRKSQKAQENEYYPVKLEGDYLRVELGNQEWLTFYTELSFEKSAGGIGLQRVVCAVSGKQLDKFEVRPGIIENLEVHHLDINPLNNRIKNLLPLRRMIHKAVHTKFPREVFPYEMPEIAWLEVDFGGYLRRQQRIQAVVASRLGYGPLRSATVAQIAAIVGDAGEEGMTLAGVKAKAIVQNINESTTKNELVALVRAGLLDRTGKGHYCGSAELP